MSSNGNNKLGQGCVVFGVSLLMSLVAGANVVGSPNINVYLNGIPHWVLVLICVAVATITAAVVLVVSGHD